MVKNSVAMKQRILKSVIFDAQSLCCNHWYSVFKSRNIYIYLELACHDEKMVASALFYKDR